jgi:hypothetical protein
MSEESPRPKSRLALPAKVLAGSVICSLLGIGLCSVGHFNFEGASSPIANAGVVAFFGGVFVGVISFVWLVIAAIMGSRN